MGESAAQPMQVSPPPAQSSAPSPVASLQCRVSPALQPLGDVGPRSSGRGVPPPPVLAPPTAAHIMPLEALVERILLSGNPWVSDELVANLRVAAALRDASVSLAASAASLQVALDNVLSFARALVAQPILPSHL